MKITVDFLSKKVVTDKETTFFQSENLANKISVYVANVSATYYLSIEFLLPNGRKTSIQTRDAFADGEANTYPINGVSYDIHNFTLNDTIMSVPGMLAFTVYINFTNNDGAVTSRGVLVNGVNMVVKTTGYSNDTILVVGDDPSATISDMQNAISLLNGLLASKADLNGNATKDFNALTMLSTTDKTKTYILTNENGETYLTVEVSNDKVKVTPKTDKPVFVDGKVLCDKIEKASTGYNGTIGTSSNPYALAYIHNLEFANLCNLNGESFLSTLNSNGVYYLELRKALIPSSNNYTIGTEINPFKGYFDGGNAKFDKFVSDDIKTGQNGVIKVGYRGDRVDDYHYLRITKDCIEDVHHIYDASDDTWDDEAGESVNIQYGINTETLTLSGSGTVNSVGSNTKSIVNKGYVDNAIANLLGIGTPAQFDTLKEIADWIAGHGIEYSALVTSVNGKADASSVYTKSATDSLLDAKANASTTYTKSEVDAMFIGDTASLIAELEGVWA